MAQKKMEADFSKRISEVRIYKSNHFKIPNKIFFIEFHMRPKY